jgi:2-polyprenyl-3-methyl-5-hydroxy-6-metoxy-1,4-benzoquinol methylase
VFAIAHACKERKTIAIVGWSAGYRVGAISSNAFGRRRSALLNRGNLVTLKITADDVRYAYRLFLGREPESKEVVENYVKSQRSLQALRGSFLRSTEFRNQSQEFLEVVESAYHQGRPDVEVIIEDSEVMQNLINRVVQQWRSLGETEPYWSVLVDDAFRTSNMDPGRIKQFYETGIGSAQLIDIFESRTNTVIPKGVCFELGCGVGRITHVLAKKFDSVIAADISPGNLGICRDHLNKSSINNVKTLLMQTPSDISTTKDVDFFFSLIVLQHNPPPVQKKLLDFSLARIRSGGFCLFQTPDNFKASNDINYSFSASRYLRETAVTMDMHCLPKPAVLDILASHGMTLLDVAPDNWIGQFGSYTYFARKN